MQVWRHARVSAAAATFLPSTPALPVPPVPSVSSPEAENPKQRAPSAGLCVCAAERRGQPVAVPAASEPSTAGEGGSGEGGSGEGGGGEGGGGEGGGGEGGPVATLIEGKSDPARERGAHCTQSVQGLCEGWGVGSRL